MFCLILIFLNLLFIKLKISTFLLKLWQAPIFLKHLSPPHLSKKKKIRNNKFFKHSSDTYSLGDFQFSRKRIKIRVVISQIWDNFRTGNSSGRGVLTRKSLIRHICNVSNQKFCKHNKKIDTSQLQFIFNAIFWYRFLY